MRELSLEIAERSAKARHRQIISSNLCSLLCKHYSSLCKLFHTGKSSREIVFEGQVRRAAFLFQWAYFRKFPVNDNDCVHSWLSQFSLLPRRSGLHIVSGPCGGRAGPDGIRCKQSTSRHRPPNSRRWKSPFLLWKKLNAQTKTDFTSETVFSLLSGILVRFLKEESLQENPQLHAFLTVYMCWGCTGRALCLELHLVKLRAQLKVWNQRLPRDIAFKFKAKDPQMTV